MRDDRIVVHLDTTLEHVDGFVGNFTSTLKTGDAEKQIKHGVTIIATGAKAYKPNEYLYGEDRRVLTHQELDRRFIEDDPELAKVQTAVFIQCVGSREPQRPYCSRVCCTHTMENAIQLKKRNPDMKVFVLYRDIRTYGERERLYQKAREMGVIFIRFGLENKPVVEAKEDGLAITVEDHVLHMPVTIKADMLALATAIQPHNNTKLGQQFKVSVNQDGFFLESHVKLAPSDFATDGVFLCGMAHYPKPIDEAIAQAQAASSRATTLLARQKISISGNVLLRQAGRLRRMRNLHRPMPLQRGKLHHRRSVGRTFPDQSDALQGLRTVHGVLSVGCDSAEGIRREPGHDSNRGGIVIMNTNTQVQKPDAPDATEAWEPKIVAFFCNWCTYGAADLAGRQPLAVSAELQSDSRALFRPDQPETDSPGIPQRRGRRVDFRLSPWRLPLHRRQPLRSATVHDVP